MMPDVNLLAVALCGVASLALGAAWYSPPIFGKAWQRLAGLSDAEAASGNVPLILGLAYLLSVMAAYVFALFLGRSMDLIPSLAAGISAGLFWVAGSFGVNYLFERRPFGLWLVNGGYHTIQFTLFGLILGAMR